MPLPSSRSWCATVSGARRARARDRPSTAAPARACSSMTRRSASVSSAGFSRYGDGHQQLAHVMEQRRPPELRRGAAGRVRARGPCAPRTPATRRPCRPIRGVRVSTMSANATATASRRPVVRSSGWRRRARAPAAGRAGSGRRARSRGQPRPMRSTTSTRPGSRLRPRSARSRPVDVRGRGGAGRARATSAASASSRAVARIGHRGCAAGPCPSQRSSAAATVSAMWSGRPRVAITAPCAQRPRQVGRRARRADSAPARAPRTGRRRCSASADGTDGPDVASRPA